MPAEVSLQDAPVLGAIEDRAQGFQLMDARGRFLRVQLAMRQLFKYCPPREVVEAVAVLQVLHLQFEHGVEGRAEEAAERHLLLGQAADPEVDLVETALVGVGAGRRRGTACGRPELGAAEVPITSARQRHACASSVVADVIDRCVPYAAMKLITETGFLRLAAKSTQLSYGSRKVEPLASKSA